MVIFPKLQKHKTRGTSKKKWVLNQWLLSISEISKFPISFGCLSAGHTIKRRYVSLIKFFVTCKAQGQPGGAVLEKKGLHRSMTVSNHAAWWWIDPSPLLFTPSPHFAPSRSDSRRSEIARDIEARRRNSPVANLKQNDRSDPSIVLRCQAARDIQFIANADTLFGDHVLETDYVRY